MSQPSAERKQRLILALCLIGGVLLTVIGIRYLPHPGRRCADVRRAGPAGGV